MISIVLNLVLIAGILAFVVYQCQDGSLLDHAMEHREELRKQEAAAEVERKRRAEEAEREKIRKEVRRELGVGYFGNSQGRVREMAREEAKSVVTEKVQPESLKPVPEFSSYAVDKIFHDAFFYGTGFGAASSKKEDPKKGKKK